jgi:hypothetical protein
MRRALLTLALMLCASDAMADTDGPCSNPMFKQQFLAAMNAKNEAMHNGVVFLTMSGVRDIWHNDNYVACRANILDNQGLTYAGVFKWSQAAGFMFTPDVQQPTD